MPIYAYECLECEHQFEELVWLDDPTPGCPKCEAKVKKLVSLPRYHQSLGDWSDLKRGANADMKPDPLTKACVEEGLRRRRNRLGGTGSMGRRRPGRTLKKG